jgi:fatty acid desaturase
MAGRIGEVSHGERKHAGSRKAPRSARTRRPIDPRVGIYAVGVTFCVVAWGYLVFAAIDFGGTAREGRSIAWLFLFVACIGAACCLFAGLMLGARALIALGIVTPPPPYADDEPSALAGSAAPSLPATPPAPRVPGGRRAAR